MSDHFQRHIDYELHSRRLANSEEGLDGLAVYHLCHCGIILLETHTVKGGPALEAVRMFGVFGERTMRYLAMQSK